MKNVLVLIHDDDGQEARLQAALDLVRAVEGHLTCVDVVGAAYEAGLPALEGMMLLVEQEERHEAGNRAALEERLAREDVSWSIADKQGPFAACLGEAAGLADVIVLNPRLEADGPDMRSIATELLVKSGKPVLIVPEESRGLDLSGSAMIAWDGSAPAMASLAAAVPLLRLADSVRILEIQGSSHGGVEDAARYLSRHGIVAEIDRVAVFAGARQEISQIIQDMAEQARCSWCVMGAYGHSPLKEMLLGGTTRRMLASARLPIFLAH
jgi:nucleotide-binding universal stress UspA family protein